MFEELDPRKGRLLQLLDENGKLSKEASKYPLMSDDEVKQAFQIMLKTRMADEWAVNLNRQGRMPTYAPNKGQEANSIGALLALNSNDWFVQAFRELGGVLTRGVPLRQWYLTWLGNELGNHFEIEKYSMLPVSVPIASQCLHGAGLAYAEKYKKSNRVVISYVGDGGTSEGDFYEAINFAGVWKAPKIFFVQNNQWGISTPRAVQTAAKTLAEKAFAAGVEGIQIDGNDIFAVFAAVKLAAQKARNGEGPTVIEGVTYRLGAHTTADDPTRYRKESDVTPWEAKEPLVRLEKYILSKKLYTEDEIKKMKEDALQYAKEEFEAAEKHAIPSIEDTFRYMYREMPEILKEQMEEIKQRIEGAK